MPTPTSIDPPQPQGQGEYSLDKLKPSFIRNFVNQAGYVQITGKQPPAYNSDLPIKTWDDTRNFTSPNNSVNYNSAVLDPTGQFPIEQIFVLSAATAKTVNIPPDTGPRPPQTGTPYPVPIRTLLINERLLAHEGGVIDVINTDIFDPNPLATLLQYVKRIARKVGA
jgi:hypothetical protein